MTEERDGAAILAAEEALRIEAGALAVLRERADLEQIVRVETNKKEYVISFSQ